MKTLFTAVSILILALLVPAANAGASLSVYGGANWTEPFDAGKIHFEPQIGSVMGVTLGTPLTSIDSDLSGQLDVSFRQNDIESDCFGGSDETLGFLANLVYRVPVGTFPLKPYVLGGVGIARRVIEVNTPWLSTYGATETGFAWQVGFGADYEIAEGVRLGAGYRRFEAPDVSRSVFGNLSTASGGNDSVVAEISFEL